MSRNHRIVLFTILGAVLAVAALAGGGRLLANTLASTYAPEQVNYQGYLTDSGGDPISGTVTLQFSIWDDPDAGEGSQIWDETHNSVVVNAGYFSVLLGSQGSPLTADDFKGSPRYLEVVYDTTTFPRQLFGSVPYALVAEYATEAITATYALNGPSGVSWQYVVIVAKSGGDYTSINDALAAITPTSSSRYLVRVMPGVYTETVTLPQYVHLRGSGAGITRITSAANGNFNDATSATLVVPANTQVSEISVSNDATTNGAVALRVSTGNANTALTDVRALTTGAGGNNHIALYLASGSPALFRVYGEASGATLGVGFNAGIFNSASSPSLRDVTLSATGINAVGLRMNGGNPIIVESTISGKNGSNGQGINTSGGGVHTVKIDRSTIIGDAGSGSSLNSTDDYDFFVGASMLDGDVDISVPPGSKTCAQSYKSNYVELNSACN